MEKSKNKTIEHLNRVLRAIRNVNQLITKEKNLDKLIKGACENLIETRGYHYAWIALLDESGKFIKAATAGLDQDFSSIINNLKDGRNTECVIKALKKPDVVSIENPSKECKDCQLAKIHPELGRITIRMEFEERIFGIMTVSIPLDLINSTEEHGLIKEIAGDIAFALHRIELEKELKQTEEHNQFLSSVVEQSADGMAIANMEGNLLFVNNKWVNMHGYEKQDELLGQNLSIFHSKKQLEEYIEPFNKNVFEQGFYTGEVGHKHKNGTIFHTQMTTTLLRDNNNNPIAMAGVATDITERKRAEKVLRDSEASYRLLFNLLPYGGEVIDTNGKIINCSSGTAQMLGYEVSELTGKNITELLTPDSVEVFHQKFPHLLNGKSVTAEIVMICKDGRKLNILRAAQPITNHNGKIESILALNVDITNRKRAETALIENEKKYRTLYENLNVGVFRVTPEDSGKFIDVNPAFLKIFGYKNRNEVLQLNVSNLYLNTNDRKKYYDEISEVGFVKDKELLLKQKDGTPIYCSISAVSVKENNKIIYFDGIIEDITQRKKTEEALHISENNLRALFNAMTDIVFEMDYNGRYINIAPTSPQLMFKPSEDTIGKTLHEVFPKPEADFFLAFIRKCLDKNKTFTIEYPLTINNNTTWFEGKATPITKNSVLYIARDITEQKQMKEALAEKTVMLDNILKSAVDMAIATTDMDFRITYFNPIAEIFFGYSAKEVIGKTVWEIHVMENVAKERLEKAIQLVRKNGEYIYFVDQKTPEGIRYLESRVSGIFDSAGKIVGYALFSNDITLRKKSEEKLQGLNEELATQNEEYVTINEELIDSMNQIQKINVELNITKERAVESDRLKTAFLLNMSHEIRTPMNSILGFIGLLNDPELSIIEKQEFTEIIKKSSERLQNTISDLIDISKIEAGQMKVINCKFSINNLLNELNRFFTPEARSKGLQLISSPTLSLGQDTIFTDNEKLHGVLTNLIKNAIKFTEKGQVTFGYFRRDNFIEFYVKDTGIGVPENRCHAIFNRFVQADIEDVSVYEGSGLGLAIAKAYVEMLGGSIWITSVEGKGSEFMFTIPYKTKTISKSETINGIVKKINTEIHTQKVFENKIVLIVEDDEVSSLYLATILKNMFSKILYAKTGNEAIELCRKNSEIDIILMDIKMPEGNGYKATHEIRKFNEDLIIIAQTAYAQTRDKELAMEAGCNDYISKPIIKDELLKMINHLMKQHG